MKRCPGKASVFGAEAFSVAAAGFTLFISAVPEQNFRRNRGRGYLREARRENRGFGNLRSCGKLKALPPCAFGGFMSNIKVFPMAMLPGWPFAPSKTPGACRQNDDSLNNDSPNIDT